MSRPFLLLYTSCSGADDLSELLDAHRFVKMGEAPYDKPKGDGFVVAGEERRINFLKRFWAAYERPIRRANGLALRIGKTDAHLEPGSAFMDVVKSFDPAVIVLRDDNMMMQAVERLAEGRGNPVPIAIEAVQRSLQTVRQDYNALDDVAEQLGPVMEVARDEIHDSASSLMASVAKLLALPDVPFEGPEGGTGALPSLEEFVANPDLVRSFAEDTEFAGLV